MSSNDHGPHSVKKQDIISRRKRKTSSCDSCRKLKTRCDFEPIVGKCHRCNVLKMECSLTADKNGEILNSINQAEKEWEQNEVEKIGVLGNQMTEVLLKLDELISLQKSTAKASDGKVMHKGEINNDYRYIESLGSVKFNHLDNSVMNSPLNAIARIDARLFKRKDRYLSFQEMCRKEFLEKFYYKNKSLCLKTSSDFLNAAHFWIIPGGIKEISNDYAEAHPFITSVFVLISMTFDDNFQYPREQEELFFIVKRLLGSASMTSPLTDHDVEAILYCSLYNIARKPFLAPDAWSVSAEGIRQLMMTVKFSKIRERVLNKEFENDDFFRLRIWTLLNICHISNAIGYGRPVLIPKDYLDDVFELAMSYPQLALGDNINYAQLKLVKVVHQMFYTQDLFQNVIKYNQFEQLHDQKVFRFLEIHEWFEKWKTLIDLDTSGSLLFNFEFYHVILSRRFISFYTKLDNPDINFKIRPYLDIGYNTAMFYSMSILNRILDLPRSLIRGSPINLWNQVVYSCLTLYEFNDRVENKFNINPLNLISRVYWHLNKIGETKNDATDTVGQIIASLVDVNRATNEEHGGNPIMSVDNEIHDNDKEDYKPLHDEISDEFSSDSFALKFSNLANFDTFEQFFEDINSRYMGPT